MELKSRLLEIHVGIKADEGIQFLKWEGKRILIEKNRSKNCGGDFFRLDCRRTAYQSLENLSSKKKTLESMEQSRKNKGF